MGKWSDLFIFETKLKNIGMKWNRIYVLLCFWVFTLGMIAQTPMILNHGKADSQECRDWVENRLSKMTLK